MTNPASPVTPDLIARLRELMAKATLLGWTVCASGTPGGASIAFGHKTIASTRDVSDAELIVAMRNALPDLLAHIETLQRRVEAAEKHLRRDGEWENIIDQVKDDLGFQEGI